MKVIELELQIANYGLDDIVKLEIGDIRLPITKIYKDRFGYVIISANNEKVINDAYISFQK